jgi:hypothetical protein
MEVGDKVVYIDREKGGLSFGEIYTIESIQSKIDKSDEPYCQDILYLKGNDTGYFDWRFRPLEEMQNTNFIGLVQ